MRPIIRARVLPSEERCPVTAKKRYTQQEATLWLANYRKRRKPGQYRLKIYECKYCPAGTYHLTKRQHWK